MIRKAALFLILSASISFASTTIDPTRNLYLGKTLGMGGAHVALSNDGEGIFSNPSGLADTDFPQITGLSRKIFLDETAYSLYSFSFPTGFGSFGAGYAGANTGGSYATSRDNNNRIVINPSIEAVSYDNSVFLISYAKDITNMIRIPRLPKNPLLFGANLKFFNQSLAGGGVSTRGTAMNIDIGATYKPLPWLTAGANLQNILGGSIQWKNSTDKLGGYYKLGVAANLPGNVVGVFDIDLPHDVLGNAMLMHAGVEWLPVNSVAVRAGLNQETGGTGMTLGLGFIQDAFRFDYAYAARPGIIGDNPHYFSLSYTGTRVVSYAKKIKSKEGAIVFLEPKDKSITSLEVLPLKAEAKYLSNIDQKTTWTIPLFSSTSESHEIKEAHELANVTFMGNKITKTGTIEVDSPKMAYGRNIFAMSGIIAPENALVTSEVRILRFEPFADTAMDYWAMEPIALNSVLGLLKGYPDKTFKPEKAITRGELTALLVRTLDLSIEARYFDKVVKFNDVGSNHWAANYISIGASLGLVQGYPDGTFKANKVLNRAEGITVIARYAKLQEKEGTADFPDLDPTFWANKFIGPAREAGLLNYLEGKTFEATRVFTRAEASEVLYRTTQIQKMVKDYWDKGIIPKTGEIPDWLIKLINMPGTSTSESTMVEPAASDEAGSIINKEKVQITYPVKKLQPKTNNTSTEKSKSF